MAALVSTISLSTALTPAQATVPQTGSQSFTFTGKHQSFTVPQGVYFLDVTAAGAGGEGGDDNGGSGGFGALVIGPMSVVPGDVWTIDVGGRGSDGSGGWGGYSGGDGGHFDGGGGGGATTMNNSQQVPPIVLGGGGGGAGGSSGSCSGGGGGVGGDHDSRGSLATKGHSGDCSDSGAGGSANQLFTYTDENIKAASAGGVGGSSADPGGGGGGGGFGGGSGGGHGLFAGGGGGGGGSLAGPIENTGIGQAASVTDGSVTLAWSVDASDAAGKTAPGNPQQSTAGTADGKQDRTGLSVDADATSTGANAGAITALNITLGGVAVLVVGLVLARLVRSRRMKGGG